MKKRLSIVVPLAWYVLNALPSSLISDYKGKGDGYASCNSYVRTLRAET
jgi:hypothetical protein